MTEQSFDAGDDDDALGGESAGYVPCDEQAASMPAIVDDANAVAGDAVGRVPNDVAAASLSEDDDAQALAGSEVGFVAKPCGCTDRQDTFTRSTSAFSGWGTSEFDGAPVWTGTGGVQNHVDGANGVIEAGPSNPAMDTIHLPFTNKPIEILFLAKIDSGEEGAGGFIWLGTKTHEGNTGSNGLTANLNISLITFGDGTFRGQINSASGTPNAPTTVNVDIRQGDWFWTRMLIEDRALSHKSWKDGDTEPADYQDTGSFSPLAPATLTPTLMEFKTNDGKSTFTLASVCIVRGLGSAGCDACSIDDFDRTVASDWGTSACEGAWSEDDTDAFDMSADVNGSEGELVYAPATVVPFAFGPGWVYDVNATIIESLSGGGPWVGDSWTLTARVYVPEVPVVTSPAEVTAGSELFLHVQRPFGSGKVVIGVSNHDDTLRYLGITSGPHSATADWAGLPGWYDLTWVHRAGPTNSDSLTLGADDVSCTSANSGTFAAHDQSFAVEATVSGHASGSGSPPPDPLLTGWTWLIDCINLEVD